MKALVQRAIWGFVLALMASVQAFAQESEFDAKRVIPYDVIRQQIVYTGTVKMEAASKDQIYDLALQHLEKTVKGFQTKLIEGNKEKGVISVSCNEQLMLKDWKTGDQKPAGSVKFKINVSVFEGAYVYDFSEFFIDKSVKFPMEKYYHANDPNIDMRKERGVELLEYMNYTVTNRVEALIRGIKKVYAQQNTSPQNTSPIE